MIEDAIAFGSRLYWAWLGVLLLARGADFLSTWIATPNLLLEGNPVARRLGWRWGAAINAAACGLCAFSPVAAGVVVTTSLLVAARNFQSAWLMRSLGEEVYRAWYLQRLREAPRGWLWFCLVAQAGLVAVLGAALMGFSDPSSFAFAAGLGLVTYAIAVAFYSSLAYRRVRAHPRQSELDRGF